MRLILRSWAASLLIGCGVVLLPSRAAATPQLDASLTARVLELTNAERHTAGLPPLALSPELSRAAQTYSQVLATSACFDHTCGPVPNVAERLAQAGYTGWRVIGENIAAGYSTPDAVVAGWMGSAGHRANILSPDFTEMGIGMNSGGGEFGTYWSEEFGGRAEASPGSPGVPASNDGQVTPTDAAPPSDPQPGPA